jgi:hypothetical protein
MQHAAKQHPASGHHHAVPTPESQLPCCQCNEHSYLNDPAACEIYTPSHGIIVEVEAYIFVVVVTRTVAPKAIPRQSLLCGVSTIVVLVAREMSDASSNCFMSGWSTSRICSERQCSELLQFLSPQASSHLRTTGDLQRGKARAGKNMAAVRRAVEGL